MAGPERAKILLKQYSEQQYASFSLNNDEELVLPALSSVPWIGAARRKDTFGKILSHKDERHVRFITKNNKPHAFLWQSKAQHIKQGVRWGIVKPESVSGKAIAALGNYRIVAHKRIAKGLSSNTQTLKLKLLDHYQDRFEALQELESLVNKNNSIRDYKVVIRRYISKLEAISQQLEAQLKEAGFQKINLSLIKQLQADIAKDIKQARSYFESIRIKNIRAHNRARGQHSVLEFVKDQMIRNLYELQGINQDVTYSNKRFFALTRGEFNDFIEDARKEVDDYDSDPRNVITAAHHGEFASKPESLVTYDFSKDKLTPNREREVLLAISFIEGWDKVDNTELSAPLVHNEKNPNPESLDIIYATRWQIHRNLITTLKSWGNYLLNVIRSFFVPTRPWVEETWKNPEFHLTSTRLMEHSKKHEPIWKKPLSFLKQLGYAVVDIFRGIRDFGNTLVLKMPGEIVNDWASTKKLLLAEEVFKKAKNEISTIKKTEKDRLNIILDRCAYKDAMLTTPSTIRLANSEYRLTAGEYNDLLNALTRGVSSFGSLFTHNIFAKDPIAGLLFTATYAVGGAVIFLPALSSSIFGANYVKGFTSFAHSMGSSKFAAAIAGGSTQGQLFATGWDLLLHGPTGIAAEALTQVTEDPLTVATYFGVAYGLGYVLANGIAGHPIPWLSEALKGDLGTAPETGYPLIGAKIAIALHEAFMTEEPEEYHAVKFSYNGNELDACNYKELAKYKHIIDRFCFSRWLSNNAAVLPKLSSKVLFNISRHVDKLFTADEALALKKILYPEKKPSIAFQIFSIPLSYIPAMLRVVMAVLLSVAAWISEKPHPWEPIKRAGKTLANKVAKDMSRLLAASAKILYLTFTVLSSLFKMVAYTLAMLLGRIAGFGNGHPGHFIHRSFGAIHVFFRKLSEFFYPARAIKNPIVAHPAHVIKEVEGSYAKLVQTISKNKKKSGEKREGDLTGEVKHFKNLFQSTPIVLEKDENDSKNLNLN